MKRKADVRVTGPVGPALVGRCRAFAVSEDGAVATDYAFMLAAVTSVGISTLSTVSGGVENLSMDIAGELAASDIIFASRNFGRDRLAVLQEGGMQRFTPSQVATIYARFADGVQRTDAQVRNAHRTWARRQADPQYSDPQRAADMVTILDMALEFRGLAPHDNI